jgi:N-methylhydantoinase A
VSAGVRVGIDVGGTFTDVVAAGPGGAMWSCKVPTTPASPAEGLLDGLRMLAPATGPYASLAHGTTLVTNAIVERRGASVGLVTTRGFRDVLEIGRQSRLHLYRLDLPPKPAPLVPRRLRREVTERVAADGTALVPLEPGDLAPIVEAFQADGVESVAVCLLHAYANPAHEQAVRALLATRFAHVSVSHEVNAEFREYERASTTVLNAAVMPLAARYLADLVVRLAREHPAPGGTRPLHLLHSAGGMMSVDAARARPLAMAMSGPAAGVAAAAHVARTLGLHRALAFDMGGTTTDVCLVADGVPETASQRRLGDYPVRLPMVAVESIGAGGGSIARVSDTGALQVGPRSAGARPGPACYGLGGSEATVSDANLLLGYLDAGRVYGGTIRLDRGRAEAALAPLARRLGLSLLDTAHAVVEVANASMLRAIRLVSVQRGYDLREFALIAYGGAGPLHAGALARQAGIARVVVPAHSGAFSALGCLVSPLRYDAVQTHRGALDAWDAGLAARRFDELEARCLAPLLHEGHAREAVEVRRAVDLRYAGQNYELEVPWRADLAALRAAFEARHRQLYGYATGERVEAVNLRVTAALPPEPGLVPAVSPGPGRTPGVSPAPPPEDAQPAYFPETGVVSLPRYERDRLGPGAAVLGPALVADAWSTVLVYPGQRLAADAAGHLALDVRPGEGSR